MASPGNVLTPQVNILIFEDDARGSTILRQILDSEGWRVRVVPDAPLLQAELKTAEYSLLIANVALVADNPALFQVLRELASVSVEDGARLRVLYIVPELDRNLYLAQLEEARLPYVLRPLHLHDFLEKVSDLLEEVKAIQTPLRMTRHEYDAARRKKKADSHTKPMFASREEFSYSEEDLAEYERLEAEESRKKTKPRIDLGNPKE